MAQRCAHELDAVGYNYGEKLYRKQHEANPHWAVYGSETAAMVSSRGVYHFPKHVNILSDIDMQCSDLGNSAVSFGSRTLEECVSGDLGWEYSLGQFLWSGIDYIGEPTPYQSRSSFFGQADTACYPKEGWHLFRAAWQCEDVVHISVHLGLERRSGDRRPRCNQCRGVRTVPQRRLPGPAAGGASGRACLPPGVAGLLRAG